MEPSGGVGKAAAELIKEMQQAQQELEQAQNKSSSTGGASFKDAMQAQAPQGQQSVQASQAVQAPEASQNVLMQAKVNASNKVATSRAIGQTAASKNSQLRDMIEGLVQGQDKMAGLMKLAMSGKKFNSTELLALQAGVYRFSQELEITSKVVEKATSGIKQTMNTQV